MNYLKLFTCQTRRILLAPLFVLVAAGLLACSSNSSSGQEASQDGSFQVGEPVTDSTIAAVAESSAGVDTLTMQEFQTQLQNMMRRMPQAKNNMDQVRSQMINQFVNRHALLAEAERQGVTVPEDSVEQRFQQIHGQFPDDSTFKSFLAQQGITVSDLRNELRESLTIQTFVDQMNEEVQEPSSQEVEDYRQEQSEQVSAQHILFQVDEGEDSTAVKAEAQTVLDSALAGANFSELARRHSEGPSAQQGGNLDYFNREQMVPPFSDAAFALSDSGDVADELVRTRFGYHIIRLTGRRTVDPMDTSQARQQLTQQREREAITNLIDSLRPNVTVRVNPEVADPEELQ